MRTSPPTLSVGGQVTAGRGKFAGLCGRAWFKAMGATPTPSVTTRPNAMVGPRLRRGHAPSLGGVRRL